MATISGTISPSDAFRLTMTITESEVNVSKNTSKVKVIGVISGVKSSYWAYNSNSTNTVKIDGTIYRPTTAYNVQNGTSTQIFSYTKTVTHANDGSKKLSVSWTFNGNLSSYNPNGSVSGSVNLTKIARHGNISKMSGSINDESAPWIEFTNPANGATKCWLELPDLTDTTQYAYRDIDVTSRYTWELTEAERTAIRATMANVESTKLTYCYANCVGETWVERRSEEATMTIVNGNPIFSDFSYRDTSDKTVAVTGNDQILVAGKSILEVSISPEQKAVAQKQATMSSYVASISGKNAQAVYLDDETVVISGISGISESTLSVTATDSRNFRTPVEKRIMVLPYADPTVVFRAERLNGFEADTVLSVSGTISLLNDGESDLNSVQSVRVRVREQGASEWGAWRELSGWTVDEKGAVSLSDLTLSLDNAKNYELEAEITDRLSSNLESVVVVAGIGVFRIGLDGRLYNNEKLLLTEDDLPDTNSMHLLGTNIVPSSDTPKGWCELVNGAGQFTILYTEPRKFSSQPSECGFLETFAYGDEQIYQRWHGQRNSLTWQRGGNVDGFSEWYLINDSQYGWAQVGKVVATSVTDCLEFTVPEMVKSRCIGYRVTAGIYTANATSGSWVDFRATRSGASIEGLVFQGVYRGNAGTTLTAKSSTSSNMIISGATNGGTTLIARVEGIVKGTGAQFYGYCESNRHEEGRCYGAALADTDGFRAVAQSAFIQPGSFIAVEALHT